jgi:hypothetical protein
MGGKRKNRKGGRKKKGPGVKVSFHHSYLSSQARNEYFNGHSVFS